MSSNATAFPVTTATPLPTNPSHKALENLCIALAVISLVIINILLFMFWRYKALGKSLIPFRRYSTDSETYATLHQSVMVKGSCQTHPPRRVQEVFRKCAHTVARVGHTGSFGKSVSSLYASSSGSNSRASLVQSDTADSPEIESKRHRSSRGKQLDRCRILAHEEAPGRRPEAGMFDEASVRFKLGHPDEDSATTGGESDNQVYCEVIDVSPSKRHGMHFRPISFDYCKDKDVTSDASFRNNNVSITVSCDNLAEGDNDDDNIYENFRRKKATSPFPSISRGKPMSHQDSMTASLSTCRTISGEYATCDAMGGWRSASFTHCRDATESVPEKCPSPSPTVSSIYEKCPTECPTYERFVEPEDPVYAHTVIRRNQRSLRQYPSSLPRNSVLNSQPLYEQPLFEQDQHEQPLYENLDKDAESGSEDNEHRYSSLHLDVSMTAHLAASDSRINVISGASPGASQAAMIRKKSSKHRIHVGARQRQDLGEGPVSPHATSPKIAIPGSPTSPKSGMTSPKSSFSAIAKEIAGLNEDHPDDDDPEESFPVMQMLSDRYSTGNFLNKFY